MQISTVRPCTFDQFTIKTLTKRFGKLEKSSKKKMASGVFCVSTPQGGSSYRRRTDIMGKFYDIYPLDKSNFESESRKLKLITYGIGQSMVCL